MRGAAVIHTVFDRNSVTGAICFGVLLTILMISSVALADDYLPLTSNVTGREIGMAYRTDGMPPTKARAESDTKSCMHDPREVPNPVADRISALARTDREAAEIELAKAITPCMAKKGWRTVINGSAAPSIERSTIAIVDVALDKISSSLPREMDEHSDLVGVKRDKTDIIYSIKIRPKSQSSADMLRGIAATDPRAAEVMNKSLMKQSLCEPQPNMYLKEGFAVVWEMFDGHGLLWRSRLTAADCR
jgi:hypothetical protein